MMNYWDKRALPWDGVPETADELQNPGAAPPGSHALAERMQ
jgi:hypothetical protein